MNVGYFKQTGTNFMVAVEFVLLSLQLVKRVFSDSDVTPTGQLMLEIDSKRN